METILEYKYQIALDKRRQEYKRVQKALKEKRRDEETLRNEVARALRGESKFKLPLLQSILEETRQSSRTPNSSAGKLRSSSANTAD